MRQDEFRTFLDGFVKLSEEQDSEQHQEMTDALFFVANDPAFIALRARTQSFVRAALSKARREAEKQ